VLYDLEVESEADRLVADRSEDPDAPLTPERMDRGFAAAERRVRNRDLIAGLEPGSWG
jgi:hypothetical protein